MSTTRGAAFALMLLGACVLHGLACSSSSIGGVPVDRGTAGGSATGSTQGAGGGTTTGGAGGASASLGATCSSNAECSSGLTCIKPTDNLSDQSLGGFGNGLCTVDCTSNPSICGIAGVCVTMDPAATATARAYCFESCTVGPALPAPPVAKCHRRPDVACRPVNNAETVFACIPICAGDADCGTRKCDIASGLCVDTPTAGKPIGSGCTASRTDSTECASGLCLAIESIPDGGTTPGICSAFCTLGSPGACGYRTSSLDAGPPAGACVLPFGQMGYNTGDLGLCLQLCDTNSDCGYTALNWTCRTDTPLRGSNHFVCFVPPAG